MANLFDWDASKYALNISKMDQEHQVLINIMNKLYSRSEAKAAKPELLKIMKELAEYTVKHFKDEEEYFSKIPNYPNASAHKKIHQDLLARVGGFVSDYEKGTSAEVSPEFFRFLKVWLAAHICGIDKKYADAAHGKLV